MRKRVSIAVAVAAVVLLVAALAARARAPFQASPSAPSDPPTGGPVAARAAAPSEAAVPGFHGVVTGSDGLPAAGARVLLYADALTAQGRSSCDDRPLLEARCGDLKEAVLAALESGALDTAPLAETTADEAGRYRLPAREGARHVLLALRGGEVARSEEVASPAEVALRLEAAQPVALRVLSAADSRPVAGARVAVVQRRPTLTVRATTGPEGDAALEAALTGALILAVTAEGFAPAVNSANPGDFVRDGKPIDVRLFPLSTIAGRVLDGADPAPGATVSSPGAGASATSDGQGRFRLQGVPVGAGTVVEAVLGERVGLARVESVARAADVEIRLERGARLSLRMVGGGPEDHVSVSLHSIRGTARRLSKPPYVFESLPPGRYSGVVFSPRHRTAELEVTLAPGESVERDVELQEACGLSGVVVDEQGAPVPRASVTPWRIVRQPDERGELETERSARGWICDEQGAFEVDGVVEGPYAVEFQAQGFRSLRQRVVAPASDLRVVLRRGASLAGRVEDEKGRGIAGARVTAKAARPAEEEQDRLEAKLQALARAHQPPDPALEARIAALEPAVREERKVHDDGEATTDASGAFTVGGLEEIAYDVEARAVGRSPGYARARAPESGLRLALGLGGALIIKVVDKVGDAVPGAIVDGRLLGEVPEGGDGSLSGGEQEGSVTRYESLVAGSYELTAEAPGYLETRRTVSVGKGERREVSLTLEEGRALGVEVEDEAGAPVPGASVRGRVPGSERDVCRGITDEAGRFSCGPLSPEDALELRASSWRDGRLLEATQTVPPGEISALLVLRPRARWSARFLAPRGAPASDCAASPSLGEVKVTPGPAPDPLKLLRLRLQMRSMNESMALIVSASPIEVSGGGYSYESGRKGRVALQAVCAEGWVAAEVDLANPPADLPLSPGAALTVVLPQPGTFHLSLYRQGGGALHRREAQGAVALTGLPPGSWDVDAYAAGSGHFQGEIQLEAGEAKELVLHAVERK